MNRVPDQVILMRMCRRRLPLRSVRHATGRSRGRPSRSCSPGSMSNAPAGPAVHDNGVARAELALGISTPSATGLSAGAPAGCGFLPPAETIMLGVVEGIASDILAHRLKRL